MYFIKKPNNKFFILNCYVFYDVLKCIKDTKTSNNFNFLETFYVNKKI